VKKILIVFSILLLPAVAFANFSIKFENTYNKKMVYILYWIDHPFNSLRPANMAAGELKALESRSLSNNYRQGKYYVIWRDESDIMHELLIDIQADTTHITVTPLNWSFETADI
jgi:hypothetical protein